MLKPHVAHDTNEPIKKQVCVVAAEGSDSGQAGRAARRVARGRADQVGAACAAAREQVGCQRAVGRTGESKDGSEVCTERDAGLVAVRSTGRHGGGDGVPEQRVLRHDVVESRDDALVCGFLCRRCVVWSRLLMGRVLGIACSLLEVRWRWIEVPNEVVDAGLVEGWSSVEKMEEEVSPGREDAHGGVPEVQLEEGAEQLLVRLLVQACSCG